MEPKKHKNQQHGFTLLELAITAMLVAVLTAIAVPGYQAYIQRAADNLALAELVQIEQRIMHFRSRRFRLPNDLAEAGLDGLSDPWGRPYEYLNIESLIVPGGKKPKIKAKGGSKPRKDHNLHPINTDFDLYSMGKDGKSVGPLTGGPSRDDLIRANNGGYFGRADEY